MTGSILNSSRLDITLQIGCGQT